MQRKYEPGSESSEITLESQNSVVVGPRGKTRREMASVVNAERYISVRIGASARVAGRSLSGILRDCLGIELECGIWE